MALARGISAGAGVRAFTDEALALDRLLGRAGDP